MSLRQISISATLSCLAAMPIWAIDVAIANAGFEQVVLPCTGNVCVALSTVAGWNGIGRFSTSSPQRARGAVSERSSGRGQRGCAWR